MENMCIYDKFRLTPPEARKTIKGGRLNGFTDINPMWRFKRMTEEFGPCGTGWKYEIVDQRIVQGADGTVAAFVDILLFYKKTDGEWSEGIPGIGGSMFIAKEKGGLYTSDECFKMALTDAIGTACKALGMSADIYFENDRTKYTSSPNADHMEVPKCKNCGSVIQGVQFQNGTKKTAEEIISMSKEKTNSALCWSCLRNSGGRNGNG